MNQVPGLGSVPKNWRVERARWLLNRKRRAVRPEDGIVTAFRDGHVTLRSNRRSDGFTEAIHEIGYQGIRKGDLVVHSMDAFAGAIGVADSDGKSSPVVHAYSPVEGVDLRFVAYSLKTLSLNGFVATLAKGIRERSTSFDASTLADVKLPVPGTEEQRRIADFLDREISIINNILALRFAQQEAIVRRMSTSMVEAMLPLEVPSSWKATALKHLFEVNRSGFWGEEPEGEQGLVCVRVADFRRGEYRAGLGATTMRSIPENQVRLRALKAGDVLLEKSGGGEKSPVGFAVSYDGKSRSVCSNFVQFLRSSEGVDARFSALLMAALYRSGRNLPFIKQTTGIQNLDVGAYMSQRIHVPGIERQRVIARVLDRQIEASTELEASIRRQVTLLKERKRALITAAVTGQIDVTTARGADLS